MESSRQCISQFRFSSYQAWLLRGLPQAATAATEGPFRDRAAAQMAVCTVRRIPLPCCFALRS